MALFSLRKKKKMEQKFWMQSSEEDRQGITARENGLGELLGEFLPCVLQLLLKADLRLVRLCRGGWSQPFGTRHS